MVHGKGIDTHYLVIAIALLAGLGFFTRALPFIFEEKFRNNTLVHTLGHYLPGCIMLILVVHTLHSMHVERFPFALAALIAILAVIGAHLWRRNMTLSVLLGTGLYTLLLRFFGS